MADLTGQSVGGYPIEKPLFAGPYDVNFQATTSADPIAVKVLREDLRGDKALNEGIVAEWDKVRALVNEQLVAILGCGMDEQHGAYCLQEMQECKTLRQIILDGMSLSWKDALQIARDIATALKVLHDNKLVHGFPWPASVLLTIDQDVKLEGSGTLASATDRPVADLVHGAPLAFVSPERFQGAPASASTDIYGLGMCLYYILAGQDPYALPDDQELIKAVVEQPPPPITTLRENTPEAVSAFLDRLLAKDPTQRYGSIDDVINDIDALQRGSEMGALTGGPAVELGPIQFPTKQEAPAPEPSQAKPDTKKTGSNLQQAPTEPDTPAVKKGLTASTQAQFFGRLKTHVDSTIAQSPEEKKGDDLFRQGQLAEALKEWKVAWESGGQHPGLRAKVELGQSTLNKEVFDTSVAQVRASLAEGSISGAEEHLEAAIEAAGDDRIREIVIGELKQEIQQRTVELKQQRTKRIIFGVTAVIIAVIVVAVLLLAGKD